MSSDERGERLLAAREQLNRLVALAGRLGGDVDPGLQRVVLVHQIEARGAAAEEVREGLGEDLVDLLEGVDESLGAGGVDLADGLAQALEGVHQIAALGFEEGRSLGEFVDLLEREEVDRTDPFQLLPQVVDLLGQSVGVVVFGGRLLQELFGHHAEFGDGGVAQPLPLGVEAGGLHLDEVQLLALALVRLPALPDLDVEFLDPGGAGADFLAESPGLLAGRRELPLLLGESGSGRDDLVLGGREFPAEALDFTAEGFKTGFEGPSLFAKTGRIGAGCRKALLGETGFGLPPVELAQGLRGFLAFRIELGGCGVHRLFELEAAALRVRPPPLRSAPAVA